MIQKEEMSQLLREKANFAQVLSQQALKYPEKEAYTYLESLTEQQSLTFSELDNEVQKITALLQEVAQEGDRILLLFPTSLHFIKALFSCFSARFVAVPFYVPVVKDIESQFDFIQKIIHDADIKVVLTVASIQEKLHFWTAKETCFSMEHLPSATQSWQKPDYSPEDLALLLYTSGSTGVPKGVQITHGNLLHNMIQLQQQNQLTEKEVVLTWLPNSPVAGIYTRLLGTLLGAQTVFFSTIKFLSDPLFWLEAISKYRVTFSAAPNFAYDLCVQAAQQKSFSFDLSCWKMAISGGEIIRIQTLKRFSQTFASAHFSLNSFYPYYGLTETLCISVPRPNHQIKPLHIDRKCLNQQKIQIVEENHPNALAFVSNGACYEDCVVYTVNPETLTLCQNNEIGEIWISSLSNTGGYWQKAEYSKSVCHCSLPSSERTFFRTGDLGFLHEGEIYITGRLKELIILYGKNFYPEDIEMTALQNVPENILSVAAFSVDLSNEESLILVLGYRNEMSLKEKETLIEKLRSVYTKQHKINVSGFILVPDEEIPRTSTRKIKRSACRNYLLSQKWSLCEAKKQSQTPVFLLKKEELFSSPMAQKQLLLAKNLASFFGSLLKMTIPQEALTKPINTFGIDSIATVKIITQLNQHFGVSISYQIFFDQTSLNDLAQQIIAHFSSDTQKISRKINYEETLNRAISLIPKELPTTSTNAQKIFMTGATGFLGSYLLYTLLKDSTKKIYCLVRARDELEALKRLQESLEKGPGWESHFMEQIVPVPGTLTEPFFGLTSAQFNLLAEEVDLILHNGANVNFVAPYEYLFEANVGSLFQIIPLAVEKKVKPIHFVSTLAVFNSPEREKMIEESSFLSQVDSLFSGYAQSKWVAERILQEVQKKNIPVSVYRPGLITGESKSGYCHTDDFLCRFIKGNLQLKHFPDISVEIDMTPVDYVAEAIVYLLQSPANIYHLANPKPIRLKEYVYWLQQNGFDIKMVGYSDWEKLLLENSLENELFPLLPFLLEKQAFTQQKILEFFQDFPLNYRCDNTLSALSNSGIFCPPLEEKQLQLYLDYFLKTGYLSKAIAY